MSEGLHGLRSTFQNKRVAYFHGRGRRTGIFRAGVVGGLAVAAGLLSSWARATPSQYFDVNSDSPDYGIVDGGSYSWDDTNWALVSGGNDPTGPWTAGNFARFPGGVGGSSYTVTVNSDESMAGLYEMVSGVNLTINATGSGALDVAGGDQGFLVNGSASSVTINAPITGVGGVAPQLSGSLYLYGNNSYSGNTVIGYSGSPLVYFNNSNSFGFPYNGIINNRATAGNYATLIGTGGQAITLSNSFAAYTSGNGFNIASEPNTPVISTGPWYGGGGAGDLLIRNNGPSSSPLTLEGGINCRSLTVSGAHGGTITMAGYSNIFDTTTVGAPGFTNIILKLATGIGSPNFVLAGGTVDPDGINQYMSFSTLAVTANSTIDFGAGASEVDFGPSSGASWTGTLNLLNWNPAIDILRIGYDQTGLTPDQLALIEFNGTGLGSATIDSSGYLVATPEPSSMFLLMGAPLMLLRRRRRG